jgi:bifunctional protein folD
MILDGKKLREELLASYKKIIEKENLKIKLAIIQVGDNEASNIYVKNKEKYCNMVGIKTDIYKLSSDTKEEELINLIDKLNKIKEVTGIILQSPVPKHIDYDKCSKTILSSKDVDGFTKENIYKLYMNEDTIMPATVKGIIVLLKKYNINIDGSNVVIIGRGNIVGKPLSLALTNENATVSLLHSHTKDITKYTKEADIIISACGTPNIITSDMIKDNSVVIDVGVNRINGKIVGDVDFESVSKKASYITPNPGGVGPMTIAMIIDNLIKLKRGC